MSMEVMSTNVRLADRKERVHEEDDLEIASPPRKVQRIGFAKQDWSKTIYRVTRIPNAIDQQHLVQIIKTLFDLEDQEFKIHSLASDSSGNAEPSWKAATISFQQSPTVLRVSPEKKDLSEWPFDICDHQGLGQYRIYFDTHFNGFTPLSPEAANPEHLIDCIFIHGWGGHPLGSFRSVGDLLYVWPRDSLPKQFHQLRVWTYGYNSSLYDKSSVGDVYEYAETFRRLLRILRRNTKVAEASAIFFVVHSLGGLIFKEAMIQMKKSDNVNDAETFRSTYGALFFGVPSQGMNLEALASLIQDLPSRYNLHHLDERDIESNRWLPNGPATILVGFASAACGRGWEKGDDYVVSLDEDHKTMVKFSENDKVGYQKVLDVTNDFVRDADSVIRLRMENLSAMRRVPEILSSMTCGQKDCLQSLYFPEMSFRENNINSPAESTCVWLLEHRNYKDWLRKRYGLLWIKGNPGAGKSTLLRHAVKSTECNRQEVVASFFFHGRGASIQKSPLGLFRSLLHQILQRIPELLSSLTILYDKKCATVGPYNEKWTWNERDLHDFFKLEVTNATKKNLIRIYIDALDECGEETATNLVDFFESIESYFSVCFACRHYPLIALANGDEICVEEGNSEDIKTFVKNSLRNRICRPAFIEQIQNEMLGISPGNFQWVSLVLPLVLHLDKNRRPLKFILRKIREVPRKLNDLYGELLQEIDEDDLPQAAYLMQWVCFALRPLSVAEMRLAMLMDANLSFSSIRECIDTEYYSETDEDMEKRVCELSKGLIEVVDLDGSKIPQFIHQSVRDFLVESGFRRLKLFTDAQISVPAYSHLRLSRACLKFTTMKEAKPLFDVDVRLGDVSEFLGYSQLYWPLHAKIAESEGISHGEFLPLFLESLSGPYLRDSVNHTWGENQIVSMAAHYNILGFIHNARAEKLEIDSKDDSGRTPLSVAAQLGNKEVAKLLIDGGDVCLDSKDARGRTPLILACTYQHVGIIELLVERGADMNLRDFQGQTALLMAARFCALDAATFLIQSGADVEIADLFGWTPLDIAEKYDNTSTADLLRKHGAKPASARRNGKKAR